MTAKTIRFLLMALLSSASNLQAAPFSPLERSQAKVIEFPTRNCVNWGAQDFRCEPLTGKGYLFVPSASWTKLVLVSHGSQGLDQRHFEYADALTRNGFAAFVMDHWTPRGIGKAHTNFAAARALGGSFQSMATDAIWAMNALQEHSPQIVSFGYLGESMGGSAASVLGKDWLHDHFGKALPRMDRVLKGMVGLYPGCFETAVGERYLPIPLLLVVGDKDNNTPADICTGLATWINENGGHAELATVTGAHHDFDAFYPVMYFGRAQNPSKCQRLFDGERIVLKASGKSYPNTTLGLELLLKDCLFWGVSGGNNGDRFIAVTQWLKFFSDHL